MSDESTPLLKQYGELKAQAGDALLFFRMGDFYELFGEDAIVASKILQITLTSRDKNKPDPLPMAGVPHHAHQAYLQKLLKAGKKVAIAEQMEDPSLVKGKQIVRREIIRVFTPAVQFDQDQAEPSYLAIALPVNKDLSEWILAALDPSTGDCRASGILSVQTLTEEIGSLPIKHFLRIAHGLPEDALATLRGNAQVLLEDLPSNYLSPDRAREAVNQQYGVASLDAFVNHECAVQALGILITYCARSQRVQSLSHLRAPAPLREPKHMRLGPRSAEHLDLLPRDDGSFCLFDLINETRSAPGARQLRRWIVEPLRDPRAISLRQTAVREIARTPGLRASLSELCSEVYDLERICGRVNTALANPRDTYALGQSLRSLPLLTERLRACEAPMLREITEALRSLSEILHPLALRILNSQKEEPPILSREGGIFKTDVDPELDRLISLSENGQKWLIDLETSERAKTGIPSLKVKYNRVFGYFIEVTQAHLKSVPEHYQRKQTTVGAERFFTEELKKFEEEIITAGGKQRALELALFEALVSAIAAETQRIMAVARLLGEIDALQSLANLANEPGWVFPEIDESRDAEIIAGRHPLVDRASHGGFVPNDLSLSPETRLALLITGPNMGGKSTTMRQVALIAILGQMGAPVPAERARWGAFSSIYTRIGAHDAIARGQSTFMVEMTELAHLLHHADERSLILLDEIGRGTSTYDGMSVAWATLEWITTQIKARTLFATHYHELTKLPESLPALANAHMEVEGSRATKGGELRFLYELRPGPANESFGIQVAKMAGIPAGVVARAWEVLEDLEAASQSSARLMNEAANLGQMSLFEAPLEPKEAEEVATALPAGLTRANELVREISEADLQQMTPLQALNFLARLQENARESAPGSA